QHDTEYFNRLNLFFDQNIKPTIYCQVCHTSMLKSSFGKHILSAKHKNNLEGTCKCLVCGKTFKHKGDYKKHNCKRVVYECSGCNKEFNRKSNYNRHINS